MPATESHKNGMSSMELAGFMRATPLQSYEARVSDWTNDYVFGFADTVEGVAEAAFPEDSEDDHYSRELMKDYASQILHNRGVYKAMYGTETEDEYRAVWRMPDEWSDLIAARALRETLRVLKGLEDLNA